MVVTVVLATLFLALPATSVTGQTGPIVVEPGWSLTRAVSFAGGQAAHFNPIDGLLYIGRRRSANDGLFRIDGGGTAIKLVDADNVGAVVVDPDDGDVFFSEDVGGTIFRSPFGGTGRATWVSGLARIHRWTGMDGVRAAEGGEGVTGAMIRGLEFG